LEILKKASESTRFPKRKNLCDSGRQLPLVRQLKTQQQQVT